MGQCHKIFDFRFFHESVSPQPLSIPLGPLQIFHNFSEIFAAQGATPVSSGGGSPPVSTTPAANFATGTAVIVIVNF